MEKKTALIAGATGLTGNFLLGHLLADLRYEKVICISRRSLERSDDKLVNIVTDFDRLEEYGSQLVADDIFCCLGTTIKKAGSKEKFRQVDFEYPLRLAELAKNNGAQQYLLVSALGADRNSPIFYNKVKGETEEAIGAVGYDGYHIFRPSLLMGPRKEKRLGEGLAKAFFRIFGFLFSGPLKKYKAVDAEKVARAMHQIAGQNISGRHIHESKELQNF